MYAPTAAVARFPAGEPLYPKVAPLTASVPCKPLTVKFVFKVPLVGAVEPYVLDCAEAVTLRVATVIFADNVGCVKV